MQSAINNMIEGQIRPNGVNDPKLISVMEKLDRSEFIPNDYKDVAFSDTFVFLEKDINTNNRFVPSPLFIAKTIQATDIKETDVVLDMHCNCGYSTAILAFLAKRVIGYEANKTLANLAKNNLNKFEIYNAAIESDIESVINTQQKFDKIIFSGSVKEIPSYVFDILSSEGGCLIAPTPIIGNMSAVNLYRKKDGKITKERIFDLVVPEIRNKP